jgi:dual specificity phosphatase 3
VVVVADFDFITTRLATGAAITGVDDVNALVNAGITHVIDCRAEFDDAALLAGSPTLLYLWNGVPDDGNADTHGDIWFGKSLRFALPALAVSHSKVYCHCAAGVNRGPSTALAIMLASGFTVVDAVRLIKAARPVARLAYQVEAIASVSALGFS